jgi:membrane protein involved in colicin uptake
METAETTAPAPLTAQLTMSPQQYKEFERESAALELAQAYTITGTPEEQALMAQYANNELRSVKGRIKHLEEALDGFLAPLRQIESHARKTFVPWIDRARAAEAFLKKELTDYQAREQARIADARRKQQEAEAAARAKANQEAAAARARAEELARQKEKEAREAEEQRLAAAAAGNAAAARAAAAKKAKAESQAQAAIDAGESKAQAAQLSAVVPEAEPIAAPAKLEGFSTRDNWTGELAQNVTEEAALALIVAAIAGVKPEDFQRDDLLGVLLIDRKAINKVAKGLKDKMKIPGFHAVNTPTAASRRT